MFSFSNNTPTCCSLCFHYYSLLDFTLPFQVQYSVELQKLAPFTKPHKKKLVDMLSIHSLKFLIHTPKNVVLNPLVFSTIPERRKIYQRTHLHSIANKFTVNPLTSAVSPPSTALLWLNSHIFIHYLVCKNITYLPKKHCNVSLQRSTIH